MVLLDIVCILYMVTNIWYTVQWLKMKIGAKGLSGYDFSLLNRLVWYTEVYQIFQSIPTGVKVI